jgi:hypothetical protein
MALFGGTILQMKNLEGTLLLENFPTCKSTIPVSSAVGRDP